MARKKDRIVGVLVNVYDETNREKANERHKRLAVSFVTVDIGCNTSYESFFEMAFITELRRKSQPAS